MARVLLWLIGLYRATASIRTPRCRYIPTCSQYAEEAIRVHGAGRGTWLAVRRISRCHPLGSHGVDLVPPPRDTATADPAHDDDDVAGGPDHSDLTEAKR